MERRFLYCARCMEIERLQPGDREVSAANPVIRRLARRYLVVLVAVAALVIVDQSIVQPMLIRVNEFAPAINVAGRQRMLSQRLTKASLALRDAAEEAAREQRLEEIRASLDQWSREHDALVAGDPTLGIHPVRTPDLEFEWEQLAPHYEAMVAAAQNIVKMGANTLSPPGVRLSTAALVEHEAYYLPTMDRIVKLMEDEAAKAVFRLRASALAIAVLIVSLLIGLGWLVVRPATLTIRSQVDELESRVARRTAELATALDSLRCEVKERENAERRNQRLAAQLSHAGRVTTMGHLTAGLAHELNQPLAAITNYASACEVLLDELPRADEIARVSGLIDKAKRSAQRAGQIVRRMRNFVRPNAAIQSPVEVNDLIREIIELCRSEIASAGAEASLELAAANGVVEADPIQIQQVLVNLVQNSLQAMAAGESPIRAISVRSSMAEDHVQIDVIDTGPGFALVDSDSAFAPFRSTKVDGLGIGLSICRSIVENHFGRIWIESGPGQGAQVSFTLPLSAEHVRRNRTQPDCLCC